MKTIIKEKHSALMVSEQFNFRFELIVFSLSTMSWATLCWIFNQSKAVVNLTKVAPFERGCQSPLEGNGAWHDEVFFERHRHRMRYERVHSKSDNTVDAARPDTSDYVSDATHRDRLPACRNRLLKNYLLKFKGNKTGGITAINPTSWPARNPSQY